MVIGINNLEAEYKTTLEVIGKLSSDRAKAINRLAALEANHVDLMAAVYSGARPEGDLEAARVEMAHLKQVVAAPYQPVKAIFQRKLNELSVAMSAEAAKGRAVETERSFRQYFNRIMAENSRRVDDWEKLDSASQQHHWQHVCRLKELQNALQFEAAEVKAAGLTAYCTERGCPPMVEDVHHGNISRPHEG